jgi:WD40 repeat protein
MSFSPDGRTIVTGGIDGVTTTRDGFTGSELYRLTGHRGQVQALAFSTDGRTLATGAADGTARIWSTASHRLEHTLTSPDGIVRSIAIGQDGRLVAVGGTSTVTIWDVASERPLQSLLLGPLRKGDVLTRVAFSADGSHVAASGGITANVWATESGKLVSRLSGHLARVNAIAFSPSTGTKVATASDDGTVRLWDVTSGRVLLTLSVGVGEQMLDVTFSRDGNYLLTTGKENLRPYPLGVAQLLRVARSLVQRSLTSDECQKYLDQSACPPLPEASDVGMLPAR